MAGELRAIGCSNSSDNGEQFAALVRIVFRTGLVRHRPLMLGSARSLDGGLLDKGCLWKNVRISIDELIS